MKIRISSRLLLILCLLFSPTFSWGQTRKAPVPRKPVKLVVGIVIDQFRYDYLTRFGDLFGPGGFKRFLDGGAVYTNANYPYFPAITALGHSVFMTGAPPAESGIVGNEWYDRETGKRVTSVNDPSTRIVGGSDGAGSSPHRLLVTTIGDQLKLASAGKSRVIGISLKDRSAVLPAGKMGDAAYWYDLPTGKLITSTYYMKEQPGWAVKFNQEKGTDSYFGKTWDRLLPVSAYSLSQPDDTSYESWSFGRTFPYVINGGESKPGTQYYKQFEATPFANEMLVNFAKAAIENEKLGADEDTDLLTISFSANDLQGHSSGPYSQEMQDMTLRTDRALADLFNYLDTKIGLSNIVVVLTADHGVAPVPEQLAKYGLGGRLNDTEVMRTVDRALSAKFGNDKYMLFGSYGDFYFDYSVLDKKRLSHEMVEDEACNAISTMKGVAACITRGQLENGRLPKTRIAGAVALGFNAGRNGDLIVVPKPFWLTGTDKDGTTHAAPYSYDTHVPVLLFGASINKGRFSRPVTPLDIAPTLADLLRIEFPSNSNGQVLTEAISR